MPRGTPPATLLLLLLLHSAGVPAPVHLLLSCNHKIVHLDDSAPWNGHKRLANCVIVEGVKAEVLHRDKRVSHSMISPFDFSKMRKKKIKQEAGSSPNVSSLRADRLLGNKTYVEEPNDIKIHTDVKKDFSMERSKTESPVIEQNARASAVSFPLRGDVSTSLPTSSTVSSLTLNFRQSKQPSSNRTRSKSDLKSKSASKIVFHGPSSGREEVRILSKKKMSENDTLWPVKHAAVVEGDVILGGLMMVGGGERSGGVYRVRLVSSVNEC